MKDLIATIDVVLMTLKDERLQVALLKRAKDPFKDLLALPGGYVHVNEDHDTRDAACRVLREKTGIISPYLEQLGTFSGKARDPRAWSLSVSYYALVPESVINNANHPDLELFPVDELRTLPFDHKDIIMAAVQRVQNKSSYSSLPVFLCAEPFSLPELQAVYEILLEEPINKVSFRRKIEELGVLAPIEGAMQSGRAHRPAQLYEIKKQFRANLSLTDRGLKAS